MIDFVTAAISAIFLTPEKELTIPQRRVLGRLAPWGRAGEGDNRSRTLIRRNSVDETSCSSSTPEGTEGVTETVSVLARSFTQTMNKSAEDATSTVSRALGRETGDELKPRIAGRRKANPLYPLGTSTRPAHHRVASAGAIRGAMRGTVQALDQVHAPQTR